MKGFFIQPAATRLTSLRTKDSVLELLLRSREEATHTRADIHELDTGYLAACRDSALQAARLLGWQVIPCVTGDGRLRTVEEIHREVWSLVSPLLNLN